MQILFVTDNPDKWPEHLFPNVQVISAKRYLVNFPDDKIKRPHIINLCRSYRYQSLGYYVSLLAEARGDKVLPNIATLQDFNVQSLVRFISEDLQELIDKSLAPLVSTDFKLSIYFGSNIAKRYEKLCAHISGLFAAPLLEVDFRKYKNSWKIREIKPISVADIPKDHYEFLQEAVANYIARRKLSKLPSSRSRYDLAILHNPKEKYPPSDERALHKFAKAASQVGFRVEFLERQDLGRLREFDALFIRETTQVNHHTYQFARRAKADGLAVIDDPDSILRCTNKVYLAELMQRHGIRTPKTIIVHKGNQDQVGEQVGFPCVLKQPDSSFSQGVIKANNEVELRAQLANLINQSELVIAQEYLPSEFDWRIGILNGKAIFACKYYMVQSHWQITRYNQSGGSVNGKAETLPVGWVPKRILATALKATNLVGKSLYGVDIKEIDGKEYLIEINDNPSIDAGVEDQVLKDELYYIVIQHFIDLVEQKKRGS